MFVYTFFFDYKWDIGVIEFGLSIFQLLFYREDLSSAMEDVDYIP